MYANIFRDSLVDGMTCTRAIRQHERDNNLARCCIVALTGLASGTARLEALSSGVDHYMTKPLSFKTLGSLLKKEEERKEEEEARRARRRASTISEQQANTTVHPPSEHDVEPHSQRPASDISPQQATEFRSGTIENESQHIQKDSESRPGPDGSALPQDGYQQPEVKHDAAQ